MGNKLKGNFHTHTYRCGHATGKDEDYVQYAINAGIETLGFSDHVPLPFLSQYPMRGDYPCMEECVASLRELRERYKNKIRILIGFECEYLGERGTNYYKALLSTGKVDYLILGEHGFIEDGIWHWYAMLFDKKKAFKKYAENVLKAVDTGLFTYVAHPDVFMTWYCNFDDDARDFSLKLIRKCKEKNMPLEINMGRLRHAQSAQMIDNPGDIQYPYPPFWDLVGKEGCDAIIGVDAHSPSDFADSNYSAFREFAQKHGVNLIDAPLNLRLTK